jgi:uncharacterized membrane protein YtjA (UPF0391 family)
MRRYIPATRFTRWEPIMSLLKWSLFFLLFAVVAAIFGFTGLAEDAAGIAKVLFVIFLVIAAAFVILGATIFKKVTNS